MEHSRSFHGHKSAALHSSSTFGNQTDRLALLDFKKRITKDPLHVMSSWNDSIPFCSWVGITCNSNKRVVILKLRDQKLTGSIPPSIGNLTQLTRINLVYNSFHGEIPHEMGRLRSLQYLILSRNSFGGKIPTNISHCTQLRLLNLQFNKLIGPVPDQFSSLLHLNDVLLYNNNLTGTIPGWMGNFSSLITLDTGRNNFQGSIPNELGRLTALRVLEIGECNLSGMVPSSIYNISSIYEIGVNQNQLHGELPSNIGITLPNLKGLYFGANKFTGNIPATLSNASRIQILDFVENGLTGTLFADLGRLRSLVGLKFGSNRLGSGKTGDLDFLNFMVNCTGLENLSLDSNRFGGEFPRAIANLSSELKYLILGNNSIHGSIPDGIGNLVNLIALGVEDNYLGGSVPNGIGLLQKLQVLAFSNNKFSGPIPSSMGNLTSLTELYMDENRFNGSIPLSLVNCQNLILLNLSSNWLTGTIPSKIFGLSSLSISLSMCNNSLTGSLPYEVGDLVNLGELDVSRNKLSGEIPKTLGNCAILERLYLQGNKFNGTIPQYLINLKGVQEIDISSNNLSGQIPEFLGKFRALKHLNLSHNYLEGELPKEGIFTNASGVSILGNDRLCGGIPELLLPACSRKKPHSSRRLLSLSPKVFIPVACALAFVIALSCFIVARSMVKKFRARPETSPSYQDWKSRVSYFELVQSTDGFSVENLIGSGSFGFVYKGVLPADGSVVAVKVLNLQQQGASKSFIAECEALRSIRHRNLLKIITVCSSIDNQGNDFKSLVFELMANGSLDLWLHPRDDDQPSQSKRLSLIQRLNIAIDVASAIDYLHNHCETPIVHCDLKPSNVLLDEDMVAHVGDFGLARFLFDASNNTSQSQTMSAGLKGSIGYIPPEYGMGGEISLLGDIYSFGILLLEMFIGKRPTDALFKDDQSIHQFTAMALPDHTLDIVDASLIIEREDVYADNHRYGNDDIRERPSTSYQQDGGSIQARGLKECVVSVMHIGLSCSAISPTDRILIDVVVNRLKAVRDTYMSLRRRS